jgi:hypothetical protein
VVHTVGRDQAYLDLLEGLVGVERNRALRSFAEADEDVVESGCLVADQFLDRVRSLAVSDIDVEKGSSARKDSGVDVIGKIALPRADHSLVGIVELLPVFEERPLARDRDRIVAVAQELQTQVGW